MYVERILVEASRTSLDPQLFTFDEERDDWSR
jgi:hypothetical protein